MTAKPDTRRLGKVQRPTTPSKDGSNERSDGPTKLDIMLKLRRPQGASLSELVSATGWQTHSVRGALSGALRKKGDVVLSERQAGERRYRVEAA